MLLRVYSNRFLRNHTGKVVPRVLPSCWKLSRFRPNPTWCISRRGLKTIRGNFQTAASDSYFWKKRNDWVSYKTTTTNLNRNHMAYPIYLDEEVMQMSSTNKYLSMSGLRQFVMLLIFMLKSVTDSRLPCGTLSWFWISDNVVPIRTQNFLSERKDFIMLGSLSFNPMLNRSFMIPYLQVVSYALSRLKNIAKRCCFCIIYSVMEVSNLAS